MKLSLEDFLETSFGAPARKGGGFGSTFRKAVKALEKSGQSYALAGSVAYSARVDPTVTGDIDFLVEPGANAEVWDAFERQGFKMRSGPPGLDHAIDQETGIGVDLMFGVGDPDESARVEATSLIVFRVTVPAITPEFMVWMYLRSPHGRHHDRGVEILRRGFANVSLLRSWLRHDGDTESLEYLKAWETRASKPAEQWKPRGKR